MKIKFNQNILKINITRKVIKMISEIDKIKDFNKKTLHRPQL